MKVSRKVKSKTNIEISEEGVIVNLGEDRQFAADSCIHHLTPGLMIGFTSKGVANLGGVQVRQLPLNSFAKIIRQEMILVIPLRDHRFIRIALGRKVMVHTNEDGFFYTHMICQLEGQVGDSGSLPDTSWLLFFQSVGLYMRCTQKWAIGPQACLPKNDGATARR